MVFRNTVLSLHSLCPFPILSETMALWNCLMRPHYQRSHKVFVSLLELVAYEEPQEHGLLSGDELREEGYMIDYVEGLVDQSISEGTVAFCGHSKQLYGASYHELEKEIFAEINSLVCSTPQLKKEEVLGKL